MRRLWERELKDETGRWTAVRVALHVVLGGVYLVQEPFQFVKRIRSRHLSYHRWAGRLLVAVGLVVGVTVLFMGLVLHLTFRVVK